MFQTKVVEKIRTHILCTITIFWKLCHLWDNLEKYHRAGRWQHGACTLQTWYLRLQTLRLCNTYCFSTAKIAALMCLNVMLYVHCLSCYLHYLHCDNSPTSRYTLSFHTITNTNMTLGNVNHLQSHITFPQWKVLNIVKNLLTQNKHSTQHIYMWSDLFNLIW
jgi:hypothetical protein